MSALLTATIRTIALLHFTHKHTKTGSTSPPETNLGTAVLSKVIQLALHRLDSADPLPLLGKQAHPHRRRRVKSRHPSLFLTTAFGCVLESPFT